MIILTIICLYYVSVTNSLLTLGCGVSAAGYQMCGTTTRLAQLSDRYTVYFQTCSAPEPATECCSPDSQHISSANWLVNDSSPTTLHHNSSHFWVGNCNKCKISVLQGQQRHRKSGMVHYCSTPAKAVPKGDHPHEAQKMFSHIFFIAMRKHSRSIQMARKRPWLVWSFNGRPTRNRCHCRVCVIIRLSTRAMCHRLCETTHARDITVRSAGNVVRPKPDQPDWWCRPCIYKHMQSS